MFCQRNFWIVFAYSIGLMQETLLHYIWQFRQFQTFHLSTRCGQLLEVIKTGGYNTDAGPDFENARLRIGEAEWAGQVEIHIKSSDWDKHKHQNDATYNNVILHVVWEDDKPIRNQLGETIPTLELKPLVDEDLLNRYTYLMNNQQWIPCESFIGETEPFHLQQFLERLLIERLEQKSKEIQSVLYSNKNDWEETFYQFFCKSLGLKVNADPMFQLATLLPQKILVKHRSNVFQLESLLFGIAGFLNEPKDNYSKQLSKEFRFLKHKYQLTEMQECQWRFLRLRPASFPTIRLAQLANLIHQNTNLFSKILEIESVQELTHLLQVQVGGYWETHYQLGAKSISRKKSFGKGLIQNVIINTIVPFLFVYAKEKGKPDIQDKALRFLTHIPAEQNTIIKHYRGLSVEVKNAGQSQSILQLKKHYCDAKKCLNCSIASQWLNK